MYVGSFVLFIDKSELKALAFSVSNTVPLYVPALTAPGVVSIPVAPFIFNKLAPVPTSNCC